MALLVLIAAALAALWLYRTGASSSASSSYSPLFPDGNGGGGDDNGNLSTADASASSVYQNNLDNLAQAISDWETGHQNPNSLALRNNNPGAIAPGGTLAVFQDIGDGWDALYSFITKHASAHPDWSLSQFMNFYVNGDPNSTGQNSQNDANFVAKYLGVDPGTSIGSLLGV
jgi:hypothetical protein